MAELKKIEIGVEDELDVEIKEVPKLPKVVPMRHFYKYIDKTRRKNNVTSLEPEQESEE